MFHVYVDAPPAVRDVLCPGQMAAGEADAVTSGDGLTVTETDAVEEHPAAQVPVTVYVVDIVGLTVTGEPVAPVFQVYVDAPPADREELCPVHMAAGEAEAVTVGIGLTVTVTEAVAVQPAVEPVTV